MLITYFQIIQQAGTLEQWKVSRNKSETLYAKKIGFQPNIQIGDWILEEEGERTMLVSFGEERQKYVIRAFLLFFKMFLWKTGLKETPKTFILDSRKMENEYLFVSLCILMQTNKLMIQYILPMHNGHYVCLC